MTENLLLALLAPLIAVALLAMMPGFTSRVSQGYVRDPYFERHARAFNGSIGVFFLDLVCERFGFSTYPSRQDIENYVARRDAQGRPLVRQMKNNRTSLDQDVPSFDSTIIYRLQEPFADMEADKARVRVSLFMVNAVYKYFEILDDSPFKEYTRRGAGGHTLVRAKSNPLVFLHLHTHDGSFGPHPHISDNGVLWGSDGRPGTRAFNEELAELTQFKRVAWAMATVQAAHENGMTSVRLDENGRAVDPTVTKEMTRAAGIGAKREKILDWLARRDPPWHPSKLATLVANVMMRQQEGRRQFEFLERAATWGEQIREARRLCQAQGQAQGQAQAHAAAQGQSATTSSTPPPPPPPEWQTVPVGTRLMAHDISPPNIGTAREDLGDKVRMRFVSPNTKAEATKVIGKEQLTHLDGQSLRLGSGTAQGTQAPTAAGQQQRVKSPSPPMDPLARARHELHQAMRWLYIRVRYRKETTNIIKTREALDRFIDDTARRPVWEGLRAGKLAVKKHCASGNHVFDVLQAIPVFAFAYCKARRARYRPTKHNRFVIHRDVLNTMTGADYRYLALLQKKRGIKLDVHKEAAEQFQERLSKAKERACERPLHRQRGAGISY